MIIVLCVCVCVCVRRVDLSSPLLHSKLEETTIHLSRMLQVREGVCASSSSSTSPFSLPPSLLPPSPYSFGPSLTLLPFSSLPSPLPILTPSPLSFPFLPSPSLPLSGERHPPGAPPEQTQHHRYWNGVALSTPPWQHSPAAPQYQLVGCTLIPCTLTSRFFFSTGTR